MRVFASVILSCLLACSSGVTGSNSTNTAPRVALDASAFCDKVITTCNATTNTTLADCVSAFTAGVHGRPRHA
jgi:hypothetical protein